MFARFVYIFLVGLLVGCVTVTDSPVDSGFDKHKAAEARISLGLSYLESKDMVKARENLEMALSYAPDYYRTLIAIAHFYQAVGDTQKAEDAYRTALRESPKNGDVLNNYGAFLCKIGQYQKADAFFNQAIEQPYYYLIAASYQNAAMCALKSGNRENAEHYFRLSLAHDPYRVVSMLQLSQLEVQNDQYQSARVRLLKFHNRFGYKPASLGLLIELETKAGNESMADQYESILAAKYPDSIQYQKYVTNEYGTNRE